MKTVNKKKYKSYQRGASCKAIKPSVRFIALGTAIRIIKKRKMYKILESI